MKCKWTPATKNLLSTSSLDLSSATDDITIVTLLSSSTSTQNYGFLFWQETLWWSLFLQFHFYCPPLLTFSLLLRAIRSGVTTPEPKPESDWLNRCDDRRTVQPLLHTPVVSACLLWVWLTVEENHFSIQGTHSRDLPSSLDLHTTGGSVSQKIRPLRRTWTLQQTRST